MSAEASEQPQIEACNNQTTVEVVVEAPQEEQEDIEPVETKVEGVKEVGADEQGAEASAEDNPVVRVDEFIDKFTENSETDDKKPEIDEITDKVIAGEEDKSDVDEESVVEKAEETNSAEEMKEVRVDQFVDNFTSNGENVAQEKVNGRSPLTSESNGDMNESLESSKESDNSLEAAMTENSLIPEIELIIKASTIDGRRKGACIFCQEYFMDLYLLAELKAISLKITTVDMKRPPVDFRSNFEAAQPPILIDTGVAILENEKIERHIMKHIPGGHNLFVPDAEVAKRIENLYNKFKILLVRQDDMSRKHVIAILRRINETLEDKGTRFLTGDTLCCFDCELMPKLQHIRVAGRFFLDFDIPVEFTYLWRYIKEMYELDAFVQSCPADQDIIHVYKMQKMSTASTLSRSKSREELEKPTYLTSVPEHI